MNQSLNGPWCIYDIFLAKQSPWQDKGALCPVWVMFLPSSCSGICVLPKPNPTAEKFFNFWLRALSSAPGTCCAHVVQPVWVLRTSSWWSAYSLVSFIDPCFSECPMTFTICLFCNSWISGPACPWIHFYICESGTVLENVKQRVLDIFCTWKGNVSIQAYGSSSIFNF